ncbi:MAG: cupredoxin domain-containing protein [Nitrososphaerales archaeon]
MIKSIHIAAIVGAIVAVVTTAYLGMENQVQLAPSPLTENEAREITIDMTTQQWRFDVVGISDQNRARASPSSLQGTFNDLKLTVTKGDTIVLKIKNLDVPHGFGLDEFGINTVTTPGEITTIKFTASQEGQFTFYCTVFCGTGHPNHKGTLIVQA